MKYLKTLSVFVLGLVLGGLLFSTGGPQLSRADERLPGDLFYMVQNFTNRLVYELKPAYADEYVVTDVSVLSSRKRCMVNAAKK